MTGNGKFAWSASIARLARDDRGTIMVLAAVTLTVLVAFAGLGVETGLWYAVKRHDQSAADLAALSGAMELAAANPYYQSSTGSGICGLAARDAARGGFPVSGFTCPNTSPGCTGPASGQMCVNNPPALGASAGDANAVEVILAQRQSTFFASFFLPSVTITTRAVAKVTVGGVPCVIGLGKTGTDLTFSGSSTADFNGCALASNSTSASSINLQGNTNLTTAWLQSAGGINNNGSTSTLTDPLQLTDAAPVTDPYSCNPPQLGCAGIITWPTVSGAEMIAPSSGGTLQPGLYTGPMSFTSGTTYLCPGVYVIDGEDNQDEAFAVSGTSTVVEMWQSGDPGSCPSSGAINGVTIIATSSGSTTKGGGFVITAGTVKLAAPTASPQTGIPSGLLFVQDPHHADTKLNGFGKEADSTITANGNTTLTGTLYTPATNVTFTGNANSGCFIIVALTVTFNGNATMNGNLSACAAAGAGGPAVLKVALTE